MTDDSRIDPFDPERNPLLKRMQEISGLLERSGHSCRFGHAETCRCDSEDCRAVVCPMRCGEHPTVDLVVHVSVLAGRLHMLFFCSSCSDYIASHGINDLLAFPPHMNLERARAFANENGAVFHANSSVALGSNSMELRGCDLKPSPSETN